MLIKNQFYLNRNESQRFGFVTKLCWLIDGDNKRYWCFDWNFRVIFKLKSFQSTNLKNFFLIRRPYLVGVITGGSTIAQWRIVFWIAFAVFNVTNIVYIIWASGEVQPWNDGYLVKNIDETASTSENNYDSPSKQIEQLKSNSLK